MSVLLIAVVPALCTRGEHYKLEVTGVVLSSITAAGSYFEPSLHIQHSHSQSFRNRKAGNQWLFGGSQSYVTDSTVGNPRAESIAD